MPGTDYNVFNLKKLYFISSVLLKDILLSLFQRPTRPAFSMLSPTEQIIKHGDNKSLHDCKLPLGNAPIKGAFEKCNSTLKIKVLHKSPFLWWARSLKDTLAGVLSLVKLQVACL